MKNKSENLFLDFDEAQKLVYLPIGDLEHHPDNPRKNLGDLSELADSIRKNGILQNLTVVPAGNSYWVVIGNRRLEAAKLAGLTELPCVVSDMGRQEQVITMLAENMQRNDLTFYEQGWGFQLAMDLGETVESIAEKSGFSTHTVKRRVKLAELDQQKLKKASERQISIADLDRLGQIKDVNERNRLLDIIGTPNFNNCIKRELESQRRAEAEERWTKMLLGMGLKKIDYARRNESKYRPSERRYINTSALGTSSYERAEDEEFFSICYGTVYFSRKATEKEEKRYAYDETERRKREYKVDVLNETKARMFQLRNEFVFSVPEVKAKHHFEVLVEAVMLPDWERCMERAYYCRYDGERFTRAETEGNGFEAVRKTVELHPYQSLLRHAYVALGDGEMQGYHDWQGKHQENLRLDKIYEVLTRIGYEMSDEEKRLQDGSHELFQTEDE